jgi:hypothetical protein
MAQARLSSSGMTRVASLASRRMISRSALNSSSKRQARASKEWIGDGPGSGDPIALESDALRLRQVQHTGQGVTCGVEFGGSPERDRCAAFTVSEVPVTRP